MSLINDALKRAKEHQPTPPENAPELQFRAPEPVVESKGSSVKLPVLVLVAVVLAGAAWFLMSSKKAAPTAEPTVEARAKAAPVPRQDTPPTPSAPSELGSAQPQAPAAGPEAAGARTLQTASALASAKSSENKAAAATVAAPIAAANTPASPAAAQVQQTAVSSAPAPAMKLQGVVYHPTRASAMINGKTFFVGDFFAGYTLKKVGANFAIISDGQTEMKLTLED